ncbi:MAG TPA: flagellin [Candidatus Hydrogenedentes bacterium]|nr:flagellin [Candidatus Hydrogenedentota bacterium]HNT86809.1 flagellin [Candidatus Hydrogenedentota bacterium]
MGLRINSNIPALNADRQTRNASGLVETSLRRLSTGLRINRAADDAAGLAIAERLNALARQSQVEINNLQSGVSVVQTAEGGLSVQQEATQRLRELALQASNGTLSDADRQAINAEAQQLIEQIGDIGENTEFNGTQLLNGSTPTIGLGTEGGIQVNLPESTAGALGIAGLDLGTQAGAQAALGTLDTALNRIDQSRAGLGAQQNRFESAIRQRETQGQNAREAESRIRDLDIALGVIDRTRGQLLQRAGLAALIQSNATPQSTLRLLGG